MTDYDPWAAMEMLLTHQQLTRILELTGGFGRKPVPIRSVAVMRRVVDLGLDQLEHQQLMWAYRDLTE